MRILGCCLIGSMMVAPMSCGSSQESKPGKPAAPATAKVKADSSHKSVPEDVDPLVPAIDIGTGLISTPNGRHGSVDFLSTGEFDFSSGVRAAFHPHGEEVCASGCAASSHPTSELTETNFGELLKQFAGEPMTQESISLEKLLFFGRQTQRWIGRHGTGPLDAKRAAFLRRELSRSPQL